MILLLFTLLLVLGISPLAVTPNYALQPLPPLTKVGTGVFNNAKGQSPQSAPPTAPDVYVQIYMPRVFYTPNNHAGVNELMANFSIAFPVFTVKGFANSDEMLSAYETG